MKRLQQIVYVCLKNYKIDVWTSSIVTVLIVKIMVVIINFSKKDIVTWYLFIEDPLCTVYGATLVLISKEVKLKSYETFDR